MSNFYKLGIFCCCTFAANKKTKNNEAYSITIFVIGTAAMTGKTQDITGRIVNAEGNPMEFVNVVLLSADSTFVQGARTMWMIKTV